jgi:hypothetical protein
MILKSSTLASMKSLPSLLKKRPLVPQLLRMLPPTRRRKKTKRLRKRRVKRAIRKTKLIP